MNLGQGEVNQIAHHAVLGHGLGVQTIRARGLLGTKVEPADVMFCGVPAIDAPVPRRSGNAAPRP
jgi:beta-glucosidase